MSSGLPGTTIQHHPSEATLVAQATGTLWQAAAIVVRAHLGCCAKCSTTVRLAEAVGGALLDGLPPVPLASDALQRALDRLDNEADSALMGRNVLAAQQGPMADHQAHSVLLPGVRNARLRRLAPGIRHAVLLRGPDDEALRLLRVKPGTALPRHSHRGAELTLVLKGAFADETGHYGPGDFAEITEEMSHRPTAEGAVDCVCLIATQGRLRFGALLSRLFGVVARV